MTIPLFICASPLPHCFSASTHARVEERVSLTNKGWWFWRPHDPLLSWFSSIQFRHLGKHGTCLEVGDGTMATQAVSYAEMEMSTCSNNLLTFLLLPSKSWNHHFFFITIQYSTERWEQDTLTKLWTGTSLKMFDPQLAGPAKAREVNKLCCNL